MQIQHKVTKESLIRRHLVRSPRELAVEKIEFFILPSNLNKTTNLERLHLLFCVDQIQCDCTQTYCGPPEAQVCLKINKKSKKTPYYNVKLNSDLQLVFHSSNASTVFNFKIPCIFTTICYSEC